MILVHRSDRPPRRGGIAAFAGEGLCEGSPPDRARVEESVAQLGSRRTAWALGSMGSAKALFGSPSPPPLLAAQTSTEIGKAAKAERDADSPGAHPNIATDNIR